MKCVVITSVITIIRSDQHVNVSNTLIYDQETAELMTVSWTVYSQLANVKMLTDLVFTELLNIISA